MVGSYCVNTILWTQYIFIVPTKRRIGRMDTKSEGRGYVTRHRQKSFCNSFADVSFLEHASTKFWYYQDVEFDYDYDYVYVTSN